MSENKAIPAIRFEGFTDAWEQRKLGELVQIYSGEAPSRFTEGESPYVKVDDLNYTLRVVLQSQHNVQEHPTIPKVKQGSVIFPKRGAAILTNKVRILGVDSYMDTNMMALTPQNIDAEFLYVLLSREGLYRIADTSTIPQINNKHIEPYDVIVPTIDEQSSISAFFSSLDNLITLHQRKYDKLVTVKKSMLEKMFPKGDAKVPEIRFAGFTDAWEQRRLGDVVAEYTDPVPTPHEGYERLGIRSHGKGTFHNYVGAGRELETAQMHRVAANKLIVNITFAWEHAVAVTDENDAGKLVSYRFPQFSLSEEIDPGFLQYLILDDDFRHHLWLASPGGAGRNRVLKIPEMLEYKIIIPKVPEQKKIAATLNELNTLITLHQRKLEKLKKIKAAMLEKMFV